MTALSAQASSTPRIQYTPRTQSLVNPGGEVEALHTFKNFPVFIGCTDQPESVDLRADMEFGICKASGFIQLSKLLPLELVYAEYHSEGLGGVWTRHHEEFAEFVRSFKPKSVLEIGGAAGTLAKLVLAKENDLHWTIVEPTPNVEAQKNLTVIKGFFDEKFELNQPVDMVVHSHVLEHLYDPMSALKNIFQFSKPGGLHLFSVPHLYKWLAAKAPNTLNFEHTTFLAEEFVDYLVQKAGFKILSKKFYAEHSIFYATQKADSLDVSLPQRYSEYKKLFLDFVEFHRNEARELNSRIESFQGKIFLFGAHIFSQFLIEQGLRSDRIECILDNSQIKQGRRLYGTSLFVKSPDVLRGAGRAGVILRAGAYTEEIKKQFSSLNSEIVYF